MLYLWLVLKMFTVDARITPLACNILRTMHWSVQNEYSEADVSGFKETPAEFSGDWGSHKQAWAFEKWKHKHANVVWVCLRTYRPIWAFCLDKAVLGWTENNIDLVILSHMKLTAVCCMTHYP